MGRPRKLECDECGGTYLLQTLQLHGFDYDLYACPKCGDTLFTLEQAQQFREVHALAEVARKPLGPLKLRQVGNSLNATLPKQLSALGFQRGRKFRWEVQAPGVLALRLLANGPKAADHKPRRVPRRPRKTALPKEWT